MMIFVTAPLEAEIPRFSDQSQRNSKKAYNSNVKWLIIIGINYFLVWDIIFFHFSLKKGKKTNFHDPEIGTTTNKNAIKTLFFAILSPQKGMGGFVIDI